MTTMYDIVVIGGGAIGAASARALARRGRRVLVLEQGGASGQAWQAAAGMLAPQIEARADDAGFRFGLAARDAYQTLAAALHATTGIDIGLWQGGIIHVARDEPEADELRRKIAWLTRAGQAAEWVSGREAAVRWPWLSTAMRSPFCVSSRALRAEVTVSLLPTLVAMKMLLPTMLSGLSLSMKNTRLPLADSWNSPGAMRSMSLRCS